MTRKLLIECKPCGLTISEEQRREHLKKIHKISVGLKGWVSKNFREFKLKHVWKKIANNRVRIEKLLGYVARVGVFACT